MTKQLARKSDRNCSGSLLPPYELDPMFDNPVIRNRIGELIARAVEKRIRKNASPVTSSKTKQA